MARSPEFDMMGYWLTRSLLPMLIYAPVSSSQFTSVSQINNQSEALKLVSGAKVGVIVATDDENFGSAVYIVGGE